MFLQFKEQRDVANKQTRFNQVSGDAEVRQPLQQALFEGAHAVADFQFNIPQQRQQLADLLRLLIGELFAAQYQQIDIRKRVQFAAAVTADGDQRDVVNGTETVLDPQPLEQLIDKFGTCFNQSFRGNTAIKSLAQPALKSVDKRLNRRAIEITFWPLARIFWLSGQVRGDSIR